MGFGDGAPVLTGKHFTNCTVIPDSVNLKSSEKDLANYSTVSTWRHKKIYTTGTKSRLQQEKKCRNK